MKKSFIRQIFSYQLILTLLMLGLLVAFLLSSYVILERELKESSNAFLNLYKGELQNTVKGMDQLLMRITDQSEDLARIKSTDANVRSLAALSLYNYLTALQQESKLSDFLVIYDDAYQISVDANSNHFDYETRQILRSYVANVITYQEERSFKWQFVTVGDVNLLYKGLIFDHHVIAVFVRTSELLAYMSNEEGSNNQPGTHTLVLADTAGYIGRIWGNEASPIKEGQLKETISTKNYYQASKSLFDGSMTLTCYTNKGSLLNQVNLGMIMVFVAFAFTVLFLFFMIRYSTREVAVPMGQIVADLEKIRLGEYQNRIDHPFHTKEFTLLQETTNQMLDEIVGLKIKAYEEHIDHQDMELKAIRLQLRPLFFLNALTTIRSLSSQSKNDEVQTYIDVLSKNVRYMFRAGFHTVALKDEMKHVASYLEMQELKYPGCLFHMTDIPQELLTWRIPQMVIHTFVENVYKYALSMDALLTLLIKVRQVTYQDEPMLLIEIEDDGVGYPEEVLAAMNGDTERLPTDGQRTGLLSIKRMMVLMYEREGLVKLKNVSPHGCHAQIYVPIQPTHEIAETKSTLSVK